MVEVNGAQLHYSDVGSGPRTVVFGHGLLWSGEMFTPQIDALSDRFRCVAVDWRGQGRSAVADSGYDMDTLTEDLVALIEHLGIAPVDYVGLSMGGFIGMRLAARHPELVARSLALLETSAEPEPAQNVPAYRKLAQVVRFVGPRPVAGRVMAIMFGQTFLTDPSRAVERVEWRRRLNSVDRVGAVRATHGVIDRAGITDEIDRITTPTLVLVGDEDVATVPDKARRIQAGITGSQLVIVPQAGHTSTIEQPDGRHRCSGAAPGSDLSPRVDDRSALGQARAVDDPPRVARARAPGAVWSSPPQRRRECLWGGRSREWARSRSPVGSPIEPRPCSLCSVDGGWLPVRAPSISLPPPRGSDTVERIKPPTRSRGPLHGKVRRVAAAGSGLPVWVRLGVGGCSGGGLLVAPSAAGDLVGGGGQSDPGGVVQGVVGGVLAVDVAGDQGHHAAQQPTVGDQDVHVTRC